MTTVTLLINSVDYSASVIKGRAKDKAQTVGTFSCTLDNKNNQYDGVFIANHVFELKFDGNEIMEGWVDDPETFIEKGTKNKRLITITGRNYKRQLYDLYITKNYFDVRGDDLLDDMLTEAGASKITYSSPSSSPTITLKANRTKLIDIIRHVAQELNYDWYVDNSGLLHFYPSGAVGADSGLDLISDESDPTNTNVIDILKKGSGKGFSIKNYIEADAGTLNDHYTDGNAPDFEPLFDCDQPTNETTFNPPAEILFLAGKTSIKVNRPAVEGTGSVGMELNLPIYNHTSWDFYDDQENQVLIRVPDIGFGFSVRPQLEDVDGNVIEFARFAAGAGSKGITEDLRDNIWHVLKFRTGASMDVVSSRKNGSWWLYNDATGGFNWSEVVGIKFVSSEIPVGFLPAYFLIDGLRLGKVRVIAIYEDVTSQGSYEKRMEPYYKPNIKSIGELQAFAEDMLDKQKYPLHDLTLTADGSNLTRYAGLNVNVKAPDDGLATLTKYRIFSITQRFDNKTVERGHDWIGEYDLIRDQFNPTQVYSSQRWELDRNPTQALFEQLQLLERERIGVSDPIQIDSVSRVSAQTTIFMSSSGPGPFPEGARDGFIFYLTAPYLTFEIGTYQYDELTDTWETVGVTAHDLLTGLFSDDHPQYLNSGRHSSTAHISDMLVQGIQPFDSDVVFTSTDRDDISWGSGTVTFADGSTQAISADVETAIPNGTSYVYFDLDDANPDELKITQTLADTIGDMVGQIARLDIPSTGNSCLIFPIYSKGLNILADNISTQTLDAIAANLGFITAGFIEGVTITVVGATGQFQVWYDGSTQVGNIRGAKLGSIDYIVVYAGSGKGVAIDCNGDTVTFVEGGDIIVDENFDAFRPAAYGGVDIGTSIYPMGKIFASSRLKIPVGTDLYG